MIYVQARQEALKITMMDFLENRMAERTRSVKADSAYLEEEEKKAVQEAQKAESEPEGAEKRDTRELEELLREFLA